MAQMQARQLLQPADPSRDGKDAETLLLTALEAEITHAFQPIVNIHSGKVVGFEALIRGHEVLGFASVPALLDRYFTGAMAVQAEAMLYRRALTRFARLNAGNAMLFYNLDGRVLQSPDFSSTSLTQGLSRAGIAPSRLCLELAGTVAELGALPAASLLRPERGDIQIAVDDFGMGHPGMQLLFRNPPDFIKIDRCFIAGVDEAPRKRLFLSTMVSLAQSIGVRTIAEGIETEAEFRICREAGCDLVQGHFIQAPTTDLAELLPSYDIVATQNRQERRLRRDGSISIRSEMEPEPALPVGSDMNLVFEAFRQDSTRSIVPVVDDDGAPLGLLHEQDLKEFIYSPFGKDLIANRGTRYKLRHFMKRCLSFDVNTPSDRILAGYAARAEDPAVLITEEGRYIGVLQASALLRLMNDRQVVQARNENPLTRLPGNLSINDYLFQAFEDGTADWAFVYFDFDNFKPFNDTFGFRQGDRAILMFADLLHKHFPEQEAFSAHIGGDDFFMGFHRPDKAGFIARIEDFVKIFANDAISFYDVETQRAGYLEGLDRNGETKRFPLLSVSCAIVLLPAGPRRATPDSIGVKLAELKQQGKKSPTKCAVWSAG